MPGTVRGLTLGVHSGLQSRVQRSGTYAFPSTCRSVRLEPEAPGPWPPGRAPAASGSQVIDVSPPCRPDHPLTGLGPRLGALGHVTALGHRTVSNPTWEKGPTCLSSVPTLFRGSQKPWDSGNFISHVEKLKDRTRKGQWGEYRGASVSPCQGDTYFPV